MLVGPPPPASTLASALRALDELRLHEPVARWVIGELRSRAGDLVRVLGAEPLLAGRALRVAGRSGRPAATLEGVVATLGDWEVRRLLDGMALYALGARVEPWRHLMWQRAVEVAHAARLLARGLPGVDPGTAYVAGLLHDVGALAFSAMHGSRYAPLGLKLAERESPLVVRAERDEFGCDHGALGGACLRAWGVADVVCQAIEVHPLIRVLHPRQISPVGRYAAVVALSEVIAQQVRLGIDADDVARWTVRDPLAAVVGLTAPVASHAARLMPVALAGVDVAANGGGSPLAQGRTA